MPPFPLRPSFSVSHSSARRLGECARDHYFTVYGSWNGWSRDIPESDPRRAAYILKQGKGLPAIVGDAVHKLVGWALNQVRIELQPDLEVGRQTAHQLLDRRVEHTRAGFWKRDPKNEPPVLEVLYGDADVDARVDRYHEELNANVDALFQNQVFLALLERRVEVLYAEDMHQVFLSATDEGGGYVALQPRHATDIGVWVIPDVVYQPIPALTPRRFVIVDWKTGKVAEASKDQVGVYAAWLSVKEGAAPENIAGVAIYLQHYTETPVQGSQAMVDVALAGLRTAAVEASKYIVDGDTARNEPLPIDAFPMLPVGSRRCRYCSFRRLCGRE